MGDGLPSVTLEILVHSFLEENPFKDVDFKSIFRKDSIEVFPGLKKNSNEIFVVDLTKSPQWPIDQNLKFKFRSSLFKDPNQRKFKLLFFSGCQEDVQDFIHFFASKSKFVVDISEHPSCPEKILLPNVEKFLDDFVMAEWLIGDLFDLLEYHTKNMLDFCNCENVSEWLLSLNAQISCKSGEDLATPYLPRARKIFGRYVHQMRCFPGNHGSLDKIKGKYFFLVLFLTRLLYSNGTERETYF
ncbi:MAG: hypothetical protein V6Z82_04585 [Flavobacteriales bacterium]